MVTTIKDAMKKYWPECRIREDLFKLTFTKYHYSMLVGHMVHRGATREEINAVIDDYELNYA